MSKIILETEQNPLTATESNSGRIAGYKDFGGRLFNLNQEGLIVRFNVEIFQNFTHMVKHPDENTFFSDYEYVRKRGGLLYNRKHFRITFAFGFGWMNIKANVESRRGTGWWYKNEEFYELHDGREYNKNTTIIDLATIFKRQNLATELSQNSL